MNRGHRLKDMAWGEFESVDIQENGKTVKKRKCNHCSNLVSNKIERVRAHLEKCDRYKPIAIGQGESSSDDGDVEMATAISSAPAPAVPLDQRRSTTPYRCRSRSPVAVSVETRSVTSPATSIRTPTGPTPSPKTPSGPSSPASTPENTVRIRKQLKLDSFVISTPPKVKAALDLQFARAFFSCNITFSAAEDPEMKKLFTMMRGGSYQPPSRRQLSEGLLNEVAGECELHMVELLKGKQVTMVQDGWSNVHNHPIIATCLHLPTSGDGGKKSIFAGSIDTGAEKKTAKYISDLAIKQIGQFEHKYKCKVVAYISDNENKIKLTRQLLQTHFQDLDASDEAHEGRLREHNLGLLVYGCAAHYFNLVEKEVTPRTVLSHLVDVAKYFRNHHQPEAWLRERGGKKPQLPNDTRWKNQCACVDTFIQNYPLYIEIRNKHSEEFAKNIAAIIDNVAIHREALNLQNQLNIVASALDRLQSDSCSLGDAVQIWFEVLEDPVLQTYKAIIQARFEDWMTPFQLVAYATHPKYRGAKLSAEQEETVFKWLQERNVDYTVHFSKFQIEDSEIFPQYIQTENFTSGMSASKWWQVVHKRATKYGKYSPEF